MTQLLPDQAEGLRRLFVPDVRRMISLVGTGTDLDYSDLLAGFAVALTGQGKRVLLLDEALCAGDRHAALNILILQDLATVAMRQGDVASAVIPTPLNVDLLAGGAHDRLQPRPRLESRIGLVNDFYRLAGTYDVVLVNAANAAIHAHPSFAWACQDVIVVAGHRPDSVTAAYAHIKALHLAGERRFHLLSAHDDPAKAESIYRSVAAVSRRHLKLMPEWLGMLPEDRMEIADFFEHLAVAVQRWPLSEQRAGQFPAMMKQLLKGASPDLAQVIAK